MSNMERTINNQLFEWDSDKAALNWQKHRIKFEDAAKIFADENRIDYLDEDHSVEENRYITIGRVDKILFVVYTERGIATRLISARKADADERRDYYAGAESY